MASSRPIHAWNYSVEDCDVLDKAGLVRYRELVGRWLFMLDGDEEHSISAQLSGMMWDDAVWRSMNEARRWAEKRKDTFTGDMVNVGVAAVSPALAGLLDRGYAAGQIIAISKLMEKSDPKQPAKGVISLRRLVDEIVADKDVFTRENFVGHDGVPYDPAEAFRAHSTAHPPDPSGASSAVWLDEDGPTAWGQSLARHERYDALSGASPEARTRSDQISDEVFDRLEAALADPAFDVVTRLRNKVVAHAADAVSRNFKPGGAVRKGLNLDEFARAQQRLLGVAQAISAGLLPGSWRGSVVPVPQYDHFRDLDLAFVPPGRLNELHGFWREHCAKQDEATKRAYDGIIPGVRRV